MADRPDTTLPARAPYSDKVAPMLILPGFAPVRRFVGVGDLAAAVLALAAEARLEPKPAHFGHPQVQGPGVNLWAVAPDGERACIAHAAGMGVTVDALRAALAAPIHTKEAA